MALRSKSGLIRTSVALLTLSWVALCLAQTPAQIPARGSEHSRLLSGTIVDQSGAVISGARIALIVEVQPPQRELLSGNDGQFSFANVAPGPFHLTITAAGFATQTVSGIRRSEEDYNFPQIALAVATNVTEVQVGLTQTEVAEQEIKIEEKQRVLGMLPNFYVSYNANAVPLSSNQKFKLAWKTSIDPVTFGMVGIVAGFEQVENHFSEYGQGTLGYGKRFGAGYADTVAGTFVGAAILPSLLKQDPRYFYKGSGGKPFRFVYAIASSVICKGDNGRWQANYSNVLGSFAAGGISNIYYPPQDRNGAGLTFENGAIGIGASAASNLFQEFIVRRLTPRLPHARNDSAKP
jgi:Carboxypeptidase regulatory-like domain